MHQKYSKPPKILPLLPESIHLNAVPPRDRAGLPADQCQDGVLDSEDSADHPGDAQQHHRPSLG